MLSILLYASTTIFVVYIAWDLSWRIWTRRYSFLPSAPTKPWLGTVPYLGSTTVEMYKTFTSFYTKYNHLYIFWLGREPFIRVGCVEWLEPILKSRDILTKAKSYDFVADWLGYGLVISKGEKWKKRRAALTGAFHFAILNDFSEIFEKNAKKLVKKLEAVANNEKVVEVQSLFCLALLDVICETSMGVKIDALESGEAEYSKAVHEVKLGLIKRHYNPLLWSNFIYRCTSRGRAFYKNINIVHKHTIDVINENIASRKKANEEKNMKGVNQPDIKRKRVLLETLLDLYDKGEIDVDGIQEEVDTFMFAGHDTGSAALCWTLYNIGRHPDIQDKLQDEIDSVSTNECSLMDKIRLLKYMENVIKESLRMYPPTAAVSRLLEKDMVICKHVLPSGTTLVIDVRSVHMNPKYWDEPSVFNPDRFASEDFLKRNPYSYIPFSAGPRNCIGQKFALLEIKVFLYFILSKFKIKSMQREDDLEIATEMITYSANGLNIEFSTR